MKTKMKPSILELFDQALLQVLQANTTRFGLTAKALCVFCRAQGFEPEEEETLDRLEYLVGKGLAAEMPKLIDKSMRVWKITDAGRRYLDESTL
jgi:hypothetical protein